MKMRVDWLLDCEPRPAQIEALARSYTGYKYRDTKNDPEGPGVALPHAGGPAKGWGHFMEMRVGKTPTALNEYLLFKRDHGVKAGFVLAPQRYKPTWALEAEKFGVDVPTHVFDSGRRKDFAKFMKDSKGEGMVFVNYEALLYKDNMVLFHEWLAGTASMMIADESVIMKNYTGQYFTRAMLLSKETQVTRPLTGLPTPQGVHDLWAQLRFARALNGFDFFPFRGRFAKMGGFKGKQVKGVREENAEELDRLLEKHCFRGRRIDWGTKIENDNEIVTLSMSPEQQRAYDEMEEDFVMWLNEDEAVTAEQVITKRMKMQQIASGFIIDNEGQPRQIQAFEATPKYMDLRARLDTEIRGKTMVVGYYTQTLENLIEGLQHMKPAIIAGEKIMKKYGRNSDAEKARFNNDPECRVIVCQSQAVKYGHTLMGNPTDPCLDLCFFENDYSLDNRRQTEERPQGEGQLGALHIWDYCSSSIETDIIGALQRKSDVADTIMKYYKN